MPNRRIACGNNEIVSQSGFGGDGFRGARNLAIQRVTPLSQFGWAETKSLDSLRIENEATSGRVADEQAHFLFSFELHDVSPGEDC